MDATGVASYVAVGSLVGCAAAVYFLSSDERAETLMRMIDILRRR